MRGRSGILVPGDDGAALWGSQPAELHRATGTAWRLRRRQVGGILDKVVLSPQPRLCNPSALPQGQLCREQCRIERDCMDSQLQGLIKAASRTDRLLILPHNDPDPDAIAGSLALRHLLQTLAGVQSLVAYKGIVGRAENAALVRYLGNPLVKLTRAHLEPPVCVALIDTQPGVGNNALPENTQADIILDHHPLQPASTGTPYMDVRPNLGATSTILAEYYQAAGIEPPQDLATALFYGIKSDTMGLGRGSSAADVAAYFYLQRRIEVEALAQIERAQVPPEYFSSLDAALHAAQQFDGLVSAYLGGMAYPDLAAELADILMRLQGARWVICLGQYRDELMLAVRTRGQRPSAGRIARAIVGAQGSAGGHGTMAGGQIPLEGSKAEDVAREILQRAFAFLEVQAPTQGKSLLA